MGFLAFFSSILAVGENRSEIQITKRWRFGSLENFRVLETCSICILDFKCLFGQC